jgi:myo-inositol-1(or 4)-monophosphatase
VAVTAARAAGRALHDLFGRVEHIRFKGAIDIVTEADLLSERIIVESLRAHFPAHDVLTEESGRSDRGGSDHHWIIDPLDGTTNFAHGYPFFAISIGLEVNGVRELGVVNAPALDEFFVAERGRGAYLNGERMAVSATSELIHALLASGFGYDPTLALSNVDHWRLLLGESQGLRRDGSATLDLCHVAAGKLDGYWEMGIRHWDSAAGALMVLESGGTVTTMRGEPYIGDAPTCLATNGLLHEAMLGALSRRP